MHTKGTTSTQGIGCLRLGNDQAALTAGSAKGRLTLYSNNEKYSALQSRDDIANNGFVYLPAPESANDNQYLIWSPNAATAIGSGTKPVYISAAGKAIASSSTVGSNTAISDTGKTDGTFTPIYLNAGTITAATTTIGSAALPIYMNAGTLTPCTASSIFSDFSSTPSTTGETLSITIAGQKRSVTLDAASTSQGGIVTTTGQSFAGAKTFTDNLFINNATQYPILYFKPSLGTSAMGAIQSGTIFSNDVITSNRMYLVEWSYTSNSATRLSKYELYAFPEVDPDRTANSTYYVLTTKPSTNTYTMNSLRLTNTTDANATKDNGTALIIGPRDGTHLTIDNNEIIAKTDGTTGGPLYLNSSSGAVFVGTLSSEGTLYISSAEDYSIIFKNGDTEAVRINPSGCLNIGTTQTSGSYGLYVAKVARFSNTIQVANSEIGGTISFNPTRSTDGKGMGAISYWASGSASATDYNLGAFYFSQYSYTDGTYTRLDYYDRYYFPAVAAGKTENNNYIILTTKSKVTVAQGGTGAGTFTAGKLLIGNGTSAIKTTDIHVNYTAGTTSTTGKEELVVGNSKASETADNTRGQLTLYTASSAYHGLMATGTTSRSSYLRDWGATGYLVATKTSDAVGDAGTPVYINGSGVATACTPSSVKAGYLCNVTTTNPTAYTRYNMIFISTGNAESSETTNYVPRSNMDINALLLQGTADASGYAALELGNNIASGTAGNKYGFIRFYSSSTGYANLQAATTTGSTTHYLPTTGGTLINSAGGTMTGALTLPNLTISNTSGISHIKFSRDDGASYLHAPTGGSIALCAKDTLALASSTLIVAGSAIYPGTSAGATLGTSSNRWGALYSTSANFTSSVTASALYLKSGDLVKGTAPSESTGCVISFCESAGTAAKNRIGMVYSYVTSSNVTNTRMYAYKPEKDSTSTAYLYAQYSADGTAKTGSSTAFYGAVWNDYAEFRSQDEKIEPGYCVTSSKNGKVYKTTKRMQYCEGIVSDTFGFSIGETDECKTPLAVSGRVLAFYNGPIENYNIGDVVCAGANGKIEKMTREEIKNYPDRIVGTVSEFPSYETWGDGNVPTAGRIWIKVK